MKRGAVFDIIGFPASARLAGSIKREPFPCSFYLLQKCCGERDAVISLKVIFPLMAVIDVISYNRMF